VTFEVPPGCIVGVLGPNGSGKTTLLRTLAGLQRPTSGSAEVLGCAPGVPGLIERVGFQPEEALPWPNLTGREHLRHMGALVGLGQQSLDERVDPWLERLGLASAADRRVRTYSTGMAKRLGLATALISEPEVLLLDEPTAGLDPVGSLVVMELLQQRAAAGVSVVLASHHLQEVEAICDRVLALVGGIVRADGTLDELLATDDTMLEVRGLTPESRPRAELALQALGAQVLASRPARRHLYALFRDWTGSGGTAP